MKCPYCKGDMFQEEATYIVEHEGEQLQLEGVPTWVCESCEATIVEDEVAEAIEDMLDHLDTVQADVDEE